MTEPARNLAAKRPRDKLRVLVSQGWMRHSLGMMRHLSRAGHSVQALVSPDDPAPLAARTRYCEAIHRLDQDDETTFIDGLIALLRRERFDVFVPVGFPVTRYIARHQRGVALHCAVAAPPADLEALVEDKLEVTRLARARGVPAPATASLDLDADLREQAGEMRLPVIVKGRGEREKGIVLRIDDWRSGRARIAETVDRWLARRRLHSEPPRLVVQELIPGWGCGVFVTYDRGECKRVFMHRRIREYPPTGGASSCARSFRDPRLLANGRRLLDGLGWHGVAMAEFRHDERDGDFKLIEVNAKFWGSLELALAAGADFVTDYLRLALGEPLDFTDEYADVTFQWLLGGDLQHAWLRARALPAVLATMLRPSVRTDIVLSDPGLLAARCSALLKRLVRGRSGA